MGSLTGGTGLKIPGALTQGIMRTRGLGCRGRALLWRFLQFDRCNHREPMLGWPPPRYPRAGVFAGAGRPCLTGCAPFLGAEGCVGSKRGGNRLESGGRPVSVHSSPLSAERALYERASGHCMSVQVLSYEVPSWGVGELYLEGERLLYHELPSARETRAEAIEHPLADRVRRYFAGESVSFDDVEVDLSWGTEFQVALAEVLR